MKMFALMTAAALTLPFAAAAQSNRGYSAVPVTAPVSDTLLTRSTLWKCTAERCATLRAEGSHLTMCQLAAAQLGPLTAFTANGTAFAPEQLAKCNIRAKGA
ncbi:CC_3452 family protein [Sphingomonas lacusdianchii]|jgi:hypothetical protein|uniref:CC_3452 family protein n=1 Tax=Sphingomonas lacusdianchii TaxID=2917992 RepID=UPI001F580405|nr:hypothetical protein [Sphingomonas sp. JXJ CY 53]